jgi:hypothetical protein
MMTPRPVASTARALLAAGTICAGTAGSALGQSDSARSYSARGQIGYLQEWEMKASLAKTATSAGADYAGPITLRHVGLCSANGAEEKSGTLELKMSSRKSDIEGTLALPDDNCRVTVSASQGYSGLLNCRDGQGVPIKFSIEQVLGIDRSAEAAIPHAQ